MYIIYCVDNDMEGASVAVVLTVSVLEGFAYTSHLLSILTAHT